MRQESSIGTKHMQPRSKWTQSNCDGVSAWVQRETRKPCGCLGSTQYDGRGRTLTLEQKWRGVTPASSHASCSRVRKLLNFLCPSWRFLLPTLCNQCELLTQSGQTSHCPEMHRARFCPCVFILLQKCPPFHSLLIQILPILQSQIKSHLFQQASLVA